MKKLNLSVSILVCVLASAGCAVQTDSEDVGSEDVGTAADAMLSGEQVYEVANVYNSGNADGFARSFASIGDYGNMNVAFGQQAEFWPGGPTAGGAHGAAITYNGQPLPSFWSTGVTSPPSNSNAYSVVVSNSNILNATLIDRTPYAAYFSLGSLMASADSQAVFTIGKKWPASQDSWNLAISLLRSATDLANSLCRPSTYVWKTAFNVQEMRDLLQSAPPGPNYRNWPAWGYTSDPAQYLHDHLTAIRGHLGSVIANAGTLESGVHGLGCTAP